MALKRCANSTLLTGRIQRCNLQKSLLSSMHESALEEEDPSPRLPGAVAAFEKTRTFEKSKTVSNVVLPLKMTRMANPFPEPVKMMSSQIITDKDRRDQMFAEAKHCLNTFRNNYFK